MDRTRLFILIFLVIFQWFLASGLIIDISVPNFKQESENATLRCLYNLGTANTLYSIKWYKNEAEFYRYEPSDAPPQQYFSLSGVFVNLEDSNEYQVSLLNLSLSSSGIYKCEVTTEAPEFHSTSARSFMTIIALPEQSPKINGLQEIYSNGEIINVNCTSSPSMPVTPLAWYVNGAKLEDSDEYQVTQLNLSLAGSGMYSCEVTTEAPEFHSIVARAFMTIIALPKESPTINGLQEIYSNGDIININCTSASSFPLTQLLVEC